MRNLVLFTVLALSSNSNALNDFKCTIKDSIILDDSGVLDHSSNLATGYIGKEFVVNRQTGIITGASITNTMSGVLPSVFDYLPQENGYKAVTHYKPNNTIDYLQVNQYVARKEKPFFYKGAFGTMVSGTCVLF
jgi:hypothetical protein